MHMHICKQADMHRILSTTDRHTKKSSHMKKSSSPSSSSSSGLHSTIHPSIVISIVVITIFAINDIGTYSHSGSSLYYRGSPVLHCCPAQVHRAPVFCIAALPRSTGLVCSSTNECSLKRDRLVVCVPQVQVSSNGRRNGFRPSMAVREIYMQLSPTR